MQQFATNSIARVAMLERMFACDVEINNNQLDTIHELAKFSDVVVDDTIAKSFICLAFFIPCKTNITTIRNKTLFFI